MILILTDAGSEPMSHAIAGALSQEYNMTCAPQVIAAGAVWDRSVEWDDLLLVVYNSGVLPTAAVQYIDAYRAAHKTEGGVIPIGVNPAFPVPPDPLSGIKAAKYDGSPEQTANIVKSAGVFLGLSLRPGNQRIFVSYRAKDGAQLARSIFDRLKAGGFEPWLDEAEENLVIGDDVQDKIRAGLETAAMVILVDTPEAPDSKWVAIEVDLANGQLVPVLPVVAGGESLSRFIQLQGLRRWALVKPNGLDGSPLTDAEWDLVQMEIDELLLSSFRRRLKILSRAQTIFEHHGYKWQTVDARLRMYRAEKKPSSKINVVTLSHCLVHDITYIPALKAYWNFLTKYAGLATLNQKLCIYDRDKVLSESEMDALSRNIPEMNAILAHYNELELLISSNFTVLGQ
jgi:hypothetical protein